MTVFVVIIEETNNFLGCFSKRSLAQASIDLTCSRLEFYEDEKKKMSIKEVDVKESVDHL